LKRKKLRQGPGIKPKPPRQGLRDFFSGRGGGGAREGKNPRRGGKRAFNPPGFLEKKGGGARGTLKKLRAQGPGGDFFFFIPFSGGGIFSFRVVTPGGRKGRKGGGAPIGGRGAGGLGAGVVAMGWGPTGPAAGLSPSNKKKNPPAGPLVGFLAPRVRGARISRFRWLGGEKVLLEKGWGGGGTVFWGAAGGPERPGKKNPRGMGISDWRGGGGGGGGRAGPTGRADKGARVGARAHFASRQLNPGLDTPRGDKSGGGVKGGGGRRGSTLVSAAGKASRGGVGRGGPARGPAPRPPGVLGLSTRPRFGRFGYFRGGGGGRARRGGFFPTRRCRHFFEGGGQRGATGAGGGIRMDFLGGTQRNLVTDLLPAFPTPAGGGR